VIGSRGGTVLGLDADDGKPRWERDLLADKAEENARITASAAIRGRRVYVPLNAVGRPAIVALHRRTGKVLWRRVVDRQDRSDMYGSPQVWRKRVFVGTSGYFGEQLTGVEVSARGSVVALRAGAGKRLWKTYTVPPGHDGGAVWSTPAVDPKTRRIYVGTGNAYHAPAGEMTDSMLALRIRNGRVLAHFQATAGDVWNGVEDSASSPDADFGASPNLFTLADGREVVGQGQKSGVYWALDRRTMEPVWSAFTGPGSFQGGIVGSTAFDRARIYGPNSTSGQVWAIGHDGSPAWTSSDATPFHFGAVSVSNGVVYSNDMGGFLTAREATTGAVVARLPLGAPSWAGVALAGGYVFTATGTTADSGYVVAYRSRG
jgi:polyvinyl alcohol dehydrogenase (cytochrome)